MSQQPDPLSASPASSSDPDLAEQAKPGHGVPSQDPEAAAQDPIEPWQAEEEHKTVYMGGGVMAGAAAGAAVGTAVAGPVGTFVGTLGGAVVGALSGAAVGSLNPADADEADDAEGEQKRRRAESADGQPPPR